MNETAGNESRRAVITAPKLHTPPDTIGLPPEAAWAMAQPVVFSADWQGRNADPQRQTEARLIWDCDSLYVRFRSSYREIYVYPGERTRRDQLWLRDVAEIFLRRGNDEPGHYLEFEISPNGDWLDLGISPGSKRDLECDLRSRVEVDHKLRVWIAALAIPMDCFTREFDPGEVWRLNLFRVEGAEPHRFYSSWQPTFTPKPNFHVPDAFGELRFSGK